MKQPYQHRGNQRDQWWKSMTQSVGAISAMLTDLPPNEVRSIVGWGNFMMTQAWYKRKFNRIAVKR